MAFTSSNLDISVSQVNAQIGVLMRRDLGLGLLFVTGQVLSVSVGGDGERVTGFVLRDGESELRADLAPSLRNPPKLRPGQSVRATAWLAFYYPESRFRLIVRDLEVLEKPASLEATVAMRRVRATPVAETPLVVAPVVETPVAEVPVAETLFAETLLAETGFDETTAESDLLGEPFAPGEASADELEPGILPPWLEEIRKRQFVAPGVPNMAAAPGNAQSNGQVEPSPTGVLTPEDLMLSPATPDDELQAWLAQLFEASESEDIELTRNEAEIVALRARGGQERFKSLGAASVARLQEREAEARTSATPAPVDEPAHPAPAEPVALPRPPVAARELLRQDTVPHRPVSRSLMDTTPTDSVTRPMQSMAIAAVPPSGSRPSALQSRVPEPQPLPDDTRQPMSWATRGVLLVLALTAFFFAAVVGFWAISTLSPP